jgi:hypothetical protein
MPIASDAIADMFMSVAEVVTARVAASGSTVYRVDVIAPSPAAALAPAARPAARVADALGLAQVVVTVQIEEENAEIPHTRRMVVLRFEPLEKARSGA